MTSNITTGDGTQAGTTDGDPSLCPRYLGSIDLGSDGECAWVEPPQNGECTLFNDTCADGYKCTALGECVELAFDPAGLYESCTQDESYQDDCERGLHCYGDVCVMNCQCSIAEPHCALEETACIASGCLPPCDPFHPECPGNLVCDFTFLGFRCLSSGPPSPGTLGDPCQTGQQCLGALVPAATCFGDIPASYPASRVPGCTDDYGCCMELCHLSDGVCSRPDAVCLPLYEYPEIADCFGDIGGCLLPQ